MKIERIIRLVAGTFVLTSLTFGSEYSPLYYSKYFLLLAVFVGFNLFQSALTGFCPLEIMLRKCIKES